ncbi:MAG: glycosyltransferase [Thermodesulfobacteriota bacterium]
MLHPEDSQTIAPDLPGQARKVLCYSPYNLWDLHGMWEITILHALRLRGAETFHVLCDGLYKQCDVFWAATNPRHRLACQQCQATVTNLSLSMGMEFGWLGHYLSPEETRTAQSWAASLEAADFFNATYGDWPVGEWVVGSVHSHLRTSSLDLSQPLVQQVYRDYLESGLVACFGLSRLLADYQPDVLLQFNGRQSSTRVAFELARRQGIRVICHERGSIKESIGLVVNANCLAIQHIKEDLWRHWGEVPLTRGELETVSRFMIGRQYGKDLSWKQFSPPPQNLDELRRQFHISPGQRVWVLFTSSDDEVVSVKEWGSCFSNQMAWIQESIHYVAQAKDITLIIRVHPNTGGAKSTGQNLALLQEFKELRDELPPQVHLVMPDDPVSSYSLMDLAELGLVYMSSTGLEMACKGKPVAVAAGCLVSDFPFVHTLKTQEEYQGVLAAFHHDQIPFQTQEIQRLAHRFAYALFFRHIIHFPLVKMPTPHTGELAYNSMEALLPGREPNLDRICDIILKGTPVCPPPTPLDFHRTEEPELAYFDSQRQPAGPSEDLPGQQPQSGGTTGRAEKASPLTVPGAGVLPDPTVSVIIPCYNYARYLPEALHSVLAQTYQDFEVIIVNDGSTDDTAAVARQLVEDHPQYRIRLINQKNTGQPAFPRNRGVTASKGKYILFLDADDLIEPTFMEECLRVLHTDPSIAIAYTDRLDFDGVDQVVLAGDYNFSRLKYANHISYCALFRREVWDAVGGIRTNVKAVEDWDFWVAAGAKGFLGRRIPKPLFKYRRHDTGIFQEALGDFERKKAQVVLNNREVYEEQAIAKAQKILGETPTPLVSVIVPTHNRPDLLVATLQSILDQTYKNHEIIVVNDCGVEVAGIVGWLNQQGNITYVRHDRNRGLAAARNTGIKLARGKYLTYLDDDDLFYPDHLETLVDFLETTDFRVAYTDAHRAHQEKQCGRYVTTERDVPYSNEFDPDRLMVFNQFPVLCLMHEKSCLEEAGLFDESLTSHEDWDLWIRLALHYPFSHIKKVTCEFSWRQDGSTMSSQKFEDFIRTLEIIHARYQDHLKDKPQVQEEQRQFLQSNRDALQTSGSGTEAADPGPEKMLHQATIALERQDWPAAEGHLRDLCQCYPDMLESYLSLSDVLTLQDKLQEAAEVLQAARRVFPESLPLWQRLGLNCRQRGDLSGAMAAFTKAWNQNPRDPEILGHLGATCLDLGLFQEARGYLQEAVQIHPRHLEAWLGLARVAQKLEDQEAFDQACWRAAALNAAHPRLRELTKGRIPDNGGAAPPPAEAVPEEPAAEPVRVLSSIIIPVFNNLSLTRQCLEAIEENTDAPHEIIVVDNGSSDGTRDYLHRLEAGGLVRAITNRANLGFAKASNQGAQAARGEYLVFLNNDTIVQPGWLRELVNAAQKDEKIGAVGAKLLYPDDSIQHAGVVFNEKKLVHHIYKYFNRDHPAVNKEREFQAVTAACMLIQKDLFFKVGAFPEGYRNGLEDVDLCFTLREQGYKNVYTPRAVVYHLESKTPGRHDRDKENSRIFRSRWYDKILCDDQNYYEEDGITIEVLDRQGNVATILAHDTNDNPFWQDAARYREEGLLNQAEACYLRAIKFNPFDPRKNEIARELADLYEAQGKHSQIEQLHQIVPGLGCYPGLPAGPEEVRESVGAV